jgi:hypothetical protein
MRKFKCPPDGSKVLVYRRPSDAFPLYLGNEERQLKAGLNIVKTASANLDAASKAQAERLLIKISETNKSLQADFNAVYTAYAADPCLDRNYLRVKVDEIRAERQNLELLFAQVRIIEAAISNGAPPVEIVSAVERALRASTSRFTRETTAMLEEAPDEVRRWQE